MSRTTEWEYCPSTAGFRRERFDVMSGGMSYTTTEFVSMVDCHQHLAGQAIHPLSTQAGQDQITAVWNLICGHPLIVQGNPQITPPMAAAINAFEASIQEYSSKMLDTLKVYADGGMFSKPCAHNWVEYVGLTGLNRFEYCSICDVKRKDAA